MKRNIWWILLLLGVGLAGLALAFPHLSNRWTRWQSVHFAAGTVTELQHKFHDGDLIFHTSKSAQSQAIQAATHSAYSHCGILYQRNGEWLVFEAVQPVKLTLLAHWIARGKGGHFATKRLHDAATALTPAALLRLKAAGTPMLGRNYDLVFGWSDDRIYCSELIWKVYDRGLHRQLGRLQQLREFDLSNPVVQAKLKERYGSRLPLHEPVISPVSIFNSPELVTVIEK